MREKLNLIIEESVLEKEYVLFEVKLITLKEGTTLRILIDKKNGGITLDECSDFAKELSLKLDLLDYFKNKYTLEVSSPGATWPINDDKSLNRVVGKNLKVIYSTEEKKYNQIKGELISFDEKQLIIMPLDEDEKVDVVRNDIESIKLELKFR